MGFGTNQASSKRDFFGDRIRQKGSKMPTTTEERLQILEAEVEQLKEKLNTPRPGVVGRTRSNFLDTFVGVFANDPLFEEMDQEILSD